MTLNASGQLSLAGSTVGQSVALELGLTATTQIGLGCANVRTLAGVATGAITLPTNLWGKSNNVAFASQTYSTAGTYSFVVPSGVSKISAVAVGAGGRNCWTYGPTYSNNGTLGGIGGSLSYSNCIPVTPGETLTVVVGNGGYFGCCGGSIIANVVPAPSQIKRGATVLLSGRAGCNGTNVGAVSYNGGAGGQNRGAGGAAGYAGAGGAASNTSTGNGSTGTGGGGGGGAQLLNNRYYGGGGGGVGLTGQGANGAGGIYNGTAFAPNTCVQGKGGSGGANGVASTTYAQGGAAGGGGPAPRDGNCGYVGGASGAGGVRIIWGGTGKSYPSNAT